MVFKGIDVYYRIADIPNLARNRKRYDQAVEFRDEVMAFLDAALIDAGVGEWTGAKVGKTDLNIGFDVDDFDAAEKVIRDAVAGTRFENFSKLSRSTFDVNEVFEAA